MRHCRWLRRLAAVAAATFSVGGPPCRQRSCRREGACSTGGPGDSAERTGHRPPGRLGRARAGGLALRVGALATLSLTASVIAPQQAALGQTPRLSEASCTLNTPTISRAEPLVDLLDVDVEVTGAGSCDLDDSVVWKVQIAELPASPTNEECKSAPEQTVIGPQSNDPKINFRIWTTDGDKAKLKVLTYYGLRVGAKLKDTEDSPVWSSGCKEIRTVPYRPTSPWPLAAEGRDSSVVLSKAKAGEGSCALEGWQYRYRKATASTWMEWVSVGLNSHTRQQMPTIVVQNLENGTLYNFQVRALNCGGEEFAGHPSGIVSAVPQAPSPPPDNNGTDNNGTDNNGTDNNGTDNNGTDNNGTGTAPPGSQTAALANYFVDDEGSVHEPDINVIVLNGISQGCDGDSDQYCPDDPVTRAQMATFLARAMKLKPPDDPDAWRFEDTVGNFHEPDIRAIAARGITQGCNPEGTKFCPNDPVTRGAMAAFLTRALALEVPSDPSVGAFDDIASHVHEDSIRAIAARGITRGCNTAGTLFCPDDHVTRAQMATFLVRAFDLGASTT